MTPGTGNDHPRVVATINQAVEFAANGQTSAAVQLLTTLLADFPVAPSVHAYLAWFLSEIGRDDEAIRHSQEAVNISAQSERVSLIHFHVLWKAGRHTEALDEMKRFLAIRPSEEYAKISRECDPRARWPGREE